MKGSVMENGYGIIPKKIMTDRRLKVESKAIYSYLCSFAGSGKTAFPGVEKMLEDLKMSENRFYKYRKPLVDFGYIKIYKKRDGNKNANNVYELVDHIIFEVDQIDPLQNEGIQIDPLQNEGMVHLQNEGMVHLQNEGTNNNNINNNNINNIYQQIADLYNDTCVSFPKIKTMSEKRKKAIKARIRTGYTVENFKEVFENMEKSKFLKGDNSRNWSATFDWAITDGNMAKILDGNYSNKPKKKGDTYKTNNSNNNRFNNFHQREYTAEELNELELKLLKR